LLHRYAEVNGVRLHYVEAGSGPLVLLLHGFPEFWFGWHRQIPMLAAAGFRVVAPDMRGYNLSDKPVGWRNYERAHLSGDIAALIRHLGADKAHVVGHDWGGIVAWATAMDHPDVVDRLVVLDGGHPREVKARFRQPRQLLKSWYVFSFQFPRLPEAVVRARNWWILRRSFESDARPGAFSPEEVQRYVEEWSQPGTISAQINYYRAAIRRSHRGMSAEANPPIEAPTMVIWGENDRYGIPEMAYCENADVPGLERVEILPGASHWVQHDEPDRVGSLLIEFLDGRK
jgi:pimeloyl-ACP methyl ester carboxylesterase